MEDLSEKEQLDAIRAWWAENGSYVMGGIVVGMLIIFGWNYWQSSVANTETGASMLFEDVMESSGRGNLDAAATAADDLFIDYPDSPYAAQARLAMARMYMDNGRDQDAAEVLVPLAEGSGSDELALLARLRLAKIQLYQNRPQDVVDLLEEMPESAYTARFNEVLGDAYVALESWPEAEAAYIAALNDNPQARTIDPSIIQLKINDLPAAGETAAVETALSEEEAVSADDLPDANADTAAEEEEAAGDETDSTGDEESGEA